MSATGHTDQKKAYHPVVVRQEPGGRFTAVAVGAPEIRAEAETIESVLEKIRASLAAWGGGLYWIPVPAAPSGPHPALPWFGHAKDDPDFAVYLDEIRRNRERADQQECSATSSTPTT